VSSTQLELIFPLSYTRKFLILLAGLCVFFLAGTWGFIAYFRFLSGQWELGSKVKYILVHFHLGAENVLAAWFASIIFLLAALAAVLCYLADRKIRKQSPAVRVFNNGWLAVIALFAAFSWDELGSLHERVGVWATEVGFLTSHWLSPLFLAFGIAGAFLVAFGWSRRSISRFSPWIFAGALAVLAVSLVVEELEEIWWEPLGMDPLHKPVAYTLVEEGAEIFAAWMLLAAALVHLGASARKAGLITTSGHARIPVAPRAGLLVILGMAVIFAAGMAVSYRLVLLPGDDGKPQDWFPSAAAALAAFLSFQLYQQVWIEKLNRYVFLALAGLALFFSAYFGSNLADWLQGTGFEFPLAGGLVLAIAALTILLLQATSPRTAQAGILLWAVLLCLTIPAGGGWALPTQYIAFAVLAVALWLCGADAARIRDEEAKGVSEPSREAGSLR
jgi:hypothetical protein